VHLKIKPSIRAKTTLVALSQNTVDSPIVKSTVFSLKSYLKDSDFADEFINQGGINEILNVISKSTGNQVCLVIAVVQLCSAGNVQSYALASLREGMSYIAGMEIVCQTADIVNQLFSLLDQEGTVGIEVFSKCHLF
jgi:hypothetical protein